MRIHFYQNSVLMEQALRKSEDSTRAYDILAQIFHREQARNKTARSLTFYFINSEWNLSLLLSSPLSLPPPSLSQSLSASSLPHSVSQSVSHSLTHSLTLSVTVSQILQTILI